MAKFYVNNVEYEFDDEKKLIDILREDLKLLSVKDGCSEGACGTCTVIIDGEAKKCCVQKAKMLENKHIITVEGLTEREKEIYTYAFASTGAVQCGFCTPGMVMCAKSLIDKNQNPTRIEAAYAIRNNYCRCTGYKKIIDAIILVAEYIKNNNNIPTQSDNAKLGDSIIRCDVPLKIQGTAKYADDIFFDDMIYASAVRSPYPRAKVIKIDIEEAKKLDGVVGILTAKDIPGSNYTGHISPDWSVMIKEGDITHMIGDSICFVYAKSKAVLEKAKQFVKVEYEELPALTTPQMALEKNAPIIHRYMPFSNEKNEGSAEKMTSNVYAERSIKRGDFENALKNSKYHITKKYFTPFTEHGFLEPECAVAIPLQDGGVMIYTSDQGTYDTRRECSGILGIPQEKLVVENAYVGGAFGGKEDMTVQPIAALGAYIFKLPVKAKLTRQESMQIHPKRHPFYMEVTHCCDENGILTGMKAEVISDTGAYGSLGGPVLERACTHAPGPYKYQNIEIHGRAVYTNNPPAGAFRGFGVTQTCFATESNINLLADMVGIDYYEIRRRNAIKPGDIMCNGQIADESTGIIETLEAVKDIYYSNKYVGIACAMKNSGVGVGLPDYGRVKLLVKNGVVEIHCGGSENGQGMGSMLIQMVANETGLKLSQIHWANANTKTDPDSGTTSGSRHTLISGEACIRACMELKKDCKNDIVNLEEFEGKEYYGEFFEPTDKLGANVKYPKSHVGYGYATQVCILNDDGTIKELVGAHEVGRLINKKACEGQIEGGMVMSLGYALTENLKVENGKVGCKYGSYGMFRADKIPELTSIIIEKKGMKYANGAIGIGEITAIPTAPAISLAYYRYDKEFRTELPLKNTSYFISQATRKKIITTDKIKGISNNSGFAM